MLLLTAATGAWAQSSYTYTDLRNQMGTGGDVILSPGYYKYIDGDGDYIEITASGVIDCNGAIIDMEGATISPVFKVTADNVTIKNLTIKNYTGTGDAIQFTGTGGSLVNVVYEVAVSPGPSANTWTLSMPASDVLLTPVYSAATIYRTVGSTETEASYETFKEAFLAAQDGDVIKLDWNVTVTNKTDLSTGNRATDDPVKFTIDFNGYTLDGSSLTSPFLDTQHDGDEITFIDSSPAQTGGLKGVLSGKTNSLVLAGGRYNFGDMTAAEIKEKWSAWFGAFGYALADGKEVVDLNNGQADDDGFMVRVDWKTYELAIGAGRFATFYDDHNVKLAEGTDISIYTIKGDGIDADRTKVTPTQITGNVIGLNTPTLVYNGSDAKQTVKLKVTNEIATSLMHAGQFKGTATDQKFTDADMAANDYYVLSGGTAFAPVRGTGTISAHKCWLEFDKSSSARSITIVFPDGNTTGLKDVDSGQLTDDSWYDLNGRKLNAAPKRKGVYIQRGKKIVK